MPRLNDLPQDEEVTVSAIGKRLCDVQEQDEEVTKPVVGKRLSDVQRLDESPEIKAMKHDDFVKAKVERIYHNQAMLKAFKVWPVPFPSKPQEKPSPFAWLSWVRNDIVKKMAENELLEPLIPYVLHRPIEIVQFDVPITKDTAPWWNKLKEEVPEWRGSVVEGLLLIHTKDASEAKRLSDMLNKFPMRRAFSDAIEAGIKWRVWPRGIVEQTTVDKMLDGVSLD